MPRREPLSLLTTRLLAAARAHDWNALSATDRELRRQLPRLVAQGPWSTSERTALQRLEQAHSAALLGCRAAGDALQLRMTQLRSNHDGWLAYALENAPSNEEAYP